MSELSIFIDESADFGEVRERPAYYLVTMVFHDQAVDISKEIAKMIAKHSTYFEHFDKVIVYYDNGQVELSTILNAVLSVLFNEVEFRKAEPQELKKPFLKSLEEKRLK